MSLKESQKRANEIVNKIDAVTGMKHDKETTFIHLAEEFGEVARQVFNEKSGRHKADMENLKEELADVYLLLARLASNYDIDLDEAFNDNIKKFEKRHNIKLQ